MLGEINHSPRTPFSAAWGVGWEGGSGPIFRAICIFLQTTKKEGGGGVSADSAPKKHSKRC